METAEFTNNRKWTRETVLDAVCRRHRDGEDLSSRHMNRNAPALFGAMHRLFGSHRKALEAAGIDPESVKRVRTTKPKPVKVPKIKPTTDFTREMVLCGLKVLEADGKSLKRGALRQRHRELWNAILVHFQDYAEALAIAGISPRRVARPAYKHWDRESVVARLKQLHARGADLCSSAVQRAHSNLANAIHAVFKSHDKALRATGIDPKSVRKQPGWLKWTRERIVKDLQRLHARGEPMTTKAILGSHSRLYDGIRRQFGKPSAALMAAGIKPQAAPRPPGKWTPEKVLDKLRRHHAKGDDLSSAHINLAAPGLYGAMNRKFGSYRNALMAAGIDPESVSRRPKLLHWSESTVLQTLKEMHQAGGDLRHGTVKEKHQPLYWAARKLFGSYPNAVREAGINYWEMSQAQIARSRIGKGKP
ncbi:MAG TPA: hypothetical protein VG269_10035 [Tepidisphaeraceae bacterium]|jgi:hypothetical protein|nr:hypothetical protein [Tepidisphaeraceae bacterium]